MTTPSPGAVISTGTQRSGETLWHGRRGWNRGALLTTGLLDGVPLRSGFLGMMRVPEPIFPRKFFAILLLGMALALGSLAQAQDAAPLLTSTSTAIVSPAPLVASSPVPAPLRSSQGMLQVLVYLFVLIGLLAAGLYFFRSGFVFLRPGAKGEKKKLQIAETRMLGNRQFLVVAEYEDRKMLIGVCPGRIDYLCTLSDRETAFSEILPEKPE